MKKFGLIGFPLEHSFSARYFNEKFFKENQTNCIYEEFPLESIEQFPKLLEKENELLGLNVTIPYKETIIPYLDEIDTVAAKIGAVNTISIVNSRTIGFNTDYLGFIDAYKTRIGAKHRNALILGTGGSSRAVAFALDQLGINWKKVSRNTGVHLSYEELDAQIIEAHQLIINTTPLGIFPNTAASPQIPYFAINKNHLIIDLIYNPAVTVFMLKGREQKATAINGLEMLYSQAEESWNCWLKQDLEWER